SLGAILYEMLTGKPPFLGNSPMDTLFQVHMQEPVPPRKLARDVPPNLEAICLKCLRKQPDQRYPTAEALADDLHQFSEGQPIKAGADPLSMVWRNLRRPSEKLAYALLAFMLGLVTGGALTLLWLRRR